ncbi:hypothetical protein [Paenarthrobacter sp. NPDC089316]|uniref:hypothetical protein n=1 Tax=unclassified Paenarthrobacter TaxID=2634190 RepID=UPI00342218DA
MYKSVDKISAQKARAKVIDRQFFPRILQDGAQYPPNFKLASLIVHLIIQAERPAYLKSVNGRGKAFSVKNHQALVRALWKLIPSECMYVNAADQRKP